MVDLDQDEMDYNGHIHLFDIIHEFPGEYVHDNNSFVTCNECFNLLCFMSDGDCDGFLHCTRPQTKEWQVGCLRADLTVEDLLYRRYELGMSWDAPMVTSRAGPEVGCSFDLCWSCYFKLKTTEPSRYIVMSREC
jgi:hypothetical protein